jgi:hypothetical protein
VKRLAVLVVVVVVGLGATAGSAGAVPRPPITSVDAL